MPLWHSSPLMRLPRLHRQPRSPVGLTSDRRDPRLTYGVDEAPRPQSDVYLVLSEEERAKGFVRPVRHRYQHETCGAVTSMGRELAETYARKPTFYGATYCVHCQMHKPVAEFFWCDGSGATTTDRVGS